MVKSKWLGFIYKFTNLWLRLEFRYPGVKKFAQVALGLFHFCRENIGSSREQHISRGKVVSRLPLTSKERLSLV